ncbi:MAG: hypothetical protein HGB11_11730 [Chlorobiales bacterium]|nr:hypothetical protein [Chlorobiales bacterium]
MKKIALVLSILIFATACTIQTHFLQSDAKTFEAVKPEDVKVYTANKLSVEYVVIGSIAADSPGDADSVLKALKEEAAKLGANAVIDVKLTKIESFASRTGLSGVAVRTK